MTISIRCYIFAETGLQRISQRVMEGLIHGYDAMPQFAGTKQKVANVIVELEEGKPARITRADGSFLHFDAAGKIHKSLVNSGFEAMETRSKRIKSKSKVVDLSPKLNREKCAIGFRIHGLSAGRLERRLRTTEAPIVAAA
jgi:hypothetical protein